MVDHHSYLKYAKRVISNSSIEFIYNQEVKGINSATNFLSTFKMEREKKIKNIFLINGCSRNKDFDLKFFRLNLIFLKRVLTPVPNKIGIFINFRNLYSNFLKKFRFLINWKQHFFKQRTFNFYQIILYEKQLQKKFLFFTKKLNFIDFYQTLLILKMSVISQSQKLSHLLLNQKFLFQNLNNRTLYIKTRQFRSQFCPFLNYEKTLMKLQIHSKKNQKQLNSELVLNSNQIYWLTNILNNELLMQVFNFQQYNKNLNFLKFQKSVGKTKFFIFLSQKQLFGKLKPNNFCQKSQFFQFASTKDFLKMFLKVKTSYQFLIFNYGFPGTSESNFVNFFYSNNNTVNKIHISDFPFCISFIFFGNHHLYLSNIYKLLSQHFFDSKMYEPIFIALDTNKIHIFKIFSQIFNLQLSQDFEQSFFEKNPFSLLEFNNIQPLQNRNHENLGPVLEVVKNYFIQLEFIDSSFKIFYKIYESAEIFLFYKIDFLQLKSNWLWFCSNVFYFKLFKYISVFSRKFSEFSRFQQNSIFLKDNLTRVCLEKFSFFHSVKNDLIESSNYNKFEEEFFEIVLKNFTFFESKFHFLKNCGHLFYKFRTNFFCNPKRIKKQIVNKNVSNQIFPFTVSNWFIRNHFYQIKKLLKHLQTARQLHLITQFSKEILFFSNFYKNFSQSKFFSYSDTVRFKLLWNWAVKRHNNKSLTWVKNRYFYSISTKKFLFGCLLSTNILYKNGFKSHLSLSRLYLSLPCYKKSKNVQKIRFIL